MIDPRAFDGRELHIADVREVDAADLRADCRRQWMHFDRMFAAVAGGLPCRHTSHSAPPELPTRATMLSKSGAARGRLLSCIRVARACSAPVCCRRAQDRSPLPEPWRRV